MNTPTFILKKSSIPFCIGSLVITPLVANADYDYCDHDYEYETSGSVRLVNDRFNEYDECEHEVELEAPAAVLGLLRQLPSVTLNGAHHRLLNETPVGENGWHTWLTGDFTTHDQFDADQSVFEIGVSRDLTKDIRVGLAYGHASVDQDFAFGGGSNIEGNFGLIEVDYKIPDSSFVVSGILYYGEWNADLDRGYLVGPVQNISRGRTDLNTLAYRLRVDWVDAYTTGKWSATPRISYTGMDTRSDSYTETGGAFPVAFEGQDYVDHEARVGVDIDYEYSDATDIRTVLEIAHRFDRQGEVEGPGFSVSTKEAHDTWGRLGFEVSHEVTDGQLLRVAVFGATEGEDATVSGAVSYNVSF